MRPRRKRFRHGARDVGELGAARSRRTEGLLDAFGEGARHRHAYLRGADHPARASAPRCSGCVRWSRCSSRISSRAASIRSSTPAATLRYRHGGKAACPLVIRCAVGRGRSWRAVPIRKIPRRGSRACLDSRWSRRATPYDAKGILKSAIRDGNPVVYFEHKRLYRSIKEDLPEGDFTVPIGVAEIRKEGTDLSIITYRRHARAVDRRGANRPRRKTGCRSRCSICARCCRWNRDAILATARRQTGKVLVVHEDRLTGGIGGEVSAIIMETRFEFLDGPVATGRGCGCSRCVQFAARRLHTARHQQNRGSDPRLAAY